MTVISMFIFLVQFAAYKPSLILDCHSRGGTKFLFSGRTKGGKLSASTTNH